MSRCSRRRWRPATAIVCTASLTVDQGDIDADVDIVNIGDRDGHRAQGGEVTDTATATVTFDPGAGGADHQDVGVAGRRRWGWALGLVYRADG